MRVYRVRCGDVFSFRERMTRAAIPSGGTLKGSFLE